VIYCEQSLSDHRLAHAPERVYTKRDREKVGIIAFKMHHVIEPLDQHHFVRPHQIAFEVLDVRGGQLFKTASVAKLIREVKNRP